MYRGKIFQRFFTRQELRLRGSKFDFESISIVKCIKYVTIYTEFLVALSGSLCIRLILFVILFHPQKKTINRYERLCAIQMAYESHDKEIAKEVVNLLYGNKDTMTYIDVHLTAVDLKGIFFAAEHSKNIYKLE